MKIILCGAITLMKDEIISRLLLGMSDTDIWCPENYEKALECIGETTEQCILILPLLIEDAARPMIASRKANELVQECRKQNKNCITIVYGPKITSDAKESHYYIDSIEPNAMTLLIHTVLEMVKK